MFHRTVNWALNRAKYRNSAQRKSGNAQRLGIEQLEARVVLAAPGDIVINEVMRDPAAVLDRNGEWFEVFNPTNDDVNINGWTIADDGNNLHVIDNQGPLVVPAGGYLVLGRNADTDLNGEVAVDYEYSDIFLANNNADQLVLLDTLSTEIDRVNWDSGATFPNPEGASMALNDPFSDNNDGHNWCESSTTFGAGDFGTPGSLNDCGNTAPDVSRAFASIETLGSPNHKFVPIEILGVRDAEGDEVKITITGIFQDEEVDTPGSGRTGPDARGVGTSVAEVRAERAGGGNGRVYHIYFEADDGRGGISQGVVLVGVGKNKKSAPVDDGAVFDSTKQPLAFRSYKRFARARNPIQADDGLSQESSPRTSAYDRIFAHLRR